MAEGQQAKVPGPVGGVLGRLIDGWSQAWNTPLNDPLPRKWRFLYALSGSSLWAYFNRKTYLGEGSLNLFILEWGTPILQVGIIGAWFAFLISHQERRCSPSRFFLEGILFPGVTVILLKFGENTLGAVAKLIFGGE